MKKCEGDGILDGWAETFLVLVIMACILPAIVIVCKVLTFIMGIFQ